MPCSACEVIAGYNELHEDQVVRVLIYQIGSLGDTIVMVPAYRAIRRHFTDKASVTVLCNRPADRRATVEDVLSATGLVDDYVTYAIRGGVRGAAGKILLGARIAAGRYDCVVYLAPSSRSESAISRDRSFYRLCGIPKLIGFRTCPALFDKTRKDLPHELQMRAERLAADRIVVTEEDYRLPFFDIPRPDADDAEQWLNDRAMGGEGPLIALCPGTNQPIKCWPLDRFEEIGRRLLSKFAARLVVVGGWREKQDGDRLISAWSAGASACGEFSVMGSAALIARCSLLIGLDAGTTHLASSLGVPSVAIYSGLNRPGQWTPIGRNSVVLRHEVPCQGCGLSVCNVPGQPCLSSISVDDVWREVSGKL